MADSDPPAAQQPPPTAAVGAGLIEMRDYTIKPVRLKAALGSKWIATHSNMASSKHVQEHFSNYIDLGGVAADVRTKNMPFLGYVWSTCACNTYFVAAHTSVSSRVGVLKQRAMLLKSTSLS